MVQYYRCTSGSPFRLSSQSNRATNMFTGAGIAQQDFSISCLSSLNVTGFLPAKGRVEYPPHSANSTPQGFRLPKGNLKHMVRRDKLATLQKLMHEIEFCYAIPAETYSEICHFVAQIYGQWTTGNNRMVNNLSISNIEPCDANHCFSICCHSLNSLI